MGMVEGLCLRSMVESGGRVNYHWGGRKGKMEREKRER